MQEKRNQVNILDLFFYFLSNWYWFVLCVVICVGIAYYRYAKTPLVYRSEATIIIKDPNNAQATARLESYSRMINQVSLSNEILQLQSRQLMAEVVKTLDADVDYTVHERLRDIELYTRTPVRMFFARNEELFPRFQAMVTTSGDQTLGLKVSHPVALDTVVTLGDTIRIAGTEIFFKPTAHWLRYGTGKEVSIVKHPLLAAAAGFDGRLKVEQTEMDGSILQLSLQDFSLQRSIDVLNTLVDKYNEDAIREKNRIAVNTAAFINERLMIIQEELGEVETSLARFKSSERVMDVGETASQYLAENRSYNSEIVSVETDIAMADYTLDYLTTAFGGYETIPSNSGLNSADVERLIAEYNAQVTRRNRLVASSSTSSPAVKQTEETLDGLKRDILGQVRNIRSGLQLKRQDYARRENESLRKFTAMPAKAKQLLSIERQQNIKETLYMFLLNN